MDKEEFLQRYKNGQRDFSNLDLRKIDLNGYDGENDLSGCNFTNSDLRQANLTLCNLSNVDFTNAKLEWTFFQGAKIDSKTILSSKYLLAWQLVEKANYRNYYNVDNFSKNDNNKNRNSFRYYDLSGVNLRLANLENLDFTGTNLFQSYLVLSNLSNANLRSANLEKSVLAWANLKGSIIDEKTKLDDKWRLVWELVNQGGENRNLEGVDLSYANLSDADLTGINLKNANLTKANIFCCNLTNANLKGANLTETTFDETILIDTILIDVKIDKTSFNRCTNIGSIYDNIPELNRTKEILNQKNNDKYIHISEISLNNYNLSNLTLTGYNFSGCYLSGINFKCSNLEFANFSKSSLIGYQDYDWGNGIDTSQLPADFSYSYLRFANFSEAKLNHVSFSGADLRKVDFTSADLSYVDLTGADLRGANLENAKLNYVNLRATIIDDSTKISEKWRFIWEFINSEYPKKINLKGVDFSYINLEYFDFSGCDLSEINLSYGIFTNCDFSHVTVKKANLAKVHFNNCKLEKAIINECNLLGSGFSDCYLVNSQWEKSSGLDGFGYSNLSEAIFSDCEMKSTSFSHSNLTSVSFINCNLNSSYWSSCNLSYTDFTNINLSNGELLNSQLLKTNFTNANLENVVFVYSPKKEDIEYMTAQIEIAIINNTNLKGTIFENKFIEKKQEKSQDYSLLVSLQRDFIHRLESGHLLNCELIGYHSELTIIEGDKLEELRDYCWQMVTKFRNSRLEPKRIFVNNLTGKLGEEVVKNRLGDLVNTVDYEIYDRGDGGIDLTLKNDDNLGIQVKTRTGDNIQDIQWKITKKEIETNIALVCIYSQEKVTEAQLHYHLILAGFMPTHEIKSEENEVFFSIENLYYGGGLKGYLESYS